MSPSQVSRPRLLVLASTYPRWAGDREPGFVHELARRLLDRFEVTVLCPHAPGALVRETLDGVLVKRYRYAPRTLERLVSDGGIVTNLRKHPWMLMLLPTFLLAQAVALWQMGHRRRADVIHAHWLLPQGLLVAGLRALGRGMAPFMVTSHGADLYALRAKPFLALKRFVLRRAGAVTVVSAAMRESIGQLGIDPRNIAIEPMGVDLAGRFHPNPRVNRVPDTLLFVGRLVEKKGLHHLVTALAAIVAVRPCVCLDVAGFGPNREELEAQVATLGLAAHVRFLGAVSQAELPALYQRAAVFVAPFVEAASGDQEGLGLVVVEALGCGCRVVVSDLPATREFGDVHPGLVRVPPGDAALLASAVLAQLALPAPVHLDEGVDSTLLRFDWSTRTTSYAERLAALALPGRVPVNPMHV